MSQPVKLSDALVLDARLAAEEQERSIAGQVEFWAKLGQSIDLLLKAPQALALRRAGGAESLTERLASVDSPAGRERVEAYLQTRPFPHYGEQGQPGLLIRTDEDGTQTVGRFVNRVFVPVEVHGKAVVARSSKLSSAPIQEPASTNSNPIQGSAKNRVSSRPKQGAA
jgi:ParD-like antitoxin of type II bacterial toxin-antitoxin system